MGTELQKEATQTGGRLPVSLGKLLTKIPGVHYHLELHPHLCFGSIGPKSSLDALNWNKEDTV